jgi:four helix bundle protein
VSKLELVLQELEETRFWIELMSTEDVVTASAVAEISDEARQLVSMLVVGINKIKSRKNRSVNAKSRTK